jgi:hypothetical protein
MGLLTAIRAIGTSSYRVTVHGVGEIPGGSFRTLGEARVYADYLATITSAVCLIHFERYGQASRLVYSTSSQGASEDDAGSSGVREPRRPKPNSSAGAMELHLPT